MRGLCSRVASSELKHSLAPGARGEAAETREVASERHKSGKTEAWRFPRTVEAISNCSRETDQQAIEQSPGQFCSCASRAKRDPGMQLGDEATSESSLLVQITPHL